MSPKISNPRPPTLATLAKRYNCSVSTLQRLKRLGHDITKDAEVIPLLISIIPNYQIPAIFADSPEISAAKVKRENHEVGFAGALKRIRETEQFLHNLYLNESNKIRKADYRKQWLILCEQLLKCEKSNIIIERANENHINRAEMLECMSIFINNLSGALNQLSSNIVKCGANKDRQDLRQIVNYEVNSILDRALSFLSEPI